MAEHESVKLTTKKIEVAWAMTEKAALNLGIHTDANAQTLCDTFKKCYQVVSDTITGK